MEWLKNCVFFRLGASIFFSLALYTFQVNSFYPVKIEKLQLFLEKYSNSIEIIISVKTYNISDKIESVIKRMR